MTFFQLKQFKLFADAAALGVMFVAGYVLLAVA